MLTGQNAAGRSYIAADEVVASGDGWTTTPDAPLGPAPAGEERADFSRATGDTRFWVLSMAPHDDPQPDLTNRIGFHKTPGVAYIYILSGEVVYLVDEGEVRLRAGRPAGRAGHRSFLAERGAGARRHADRDGERRLIGPSDQRRHPSDPYPGRSPRP